MQQDELNLTVFLPLKSLISVCLKVKFKIILFRYGEHAKTLTMCLIIKANGCSTSAFRPLAWLLQDAFSSFLPCPPSHHPQPSPAFSFKKSLSEEIKSGWRHSWASVTGWKHLKWVYNESNNGVGKHNLPGQGPQRGRESGGEWWLQRRLAGHDEPSFPMIRQGQSRRWTSSNSASLSAGRALGAEPWPGLLITEHWTGKSHMTGCFHRVLANSVATLYLLK